MIPIPNLPWRLIVISFVSIIAFATGFKVANWRRDSLELAVVEAAEKASVASRQAAVSAIKGIDIQRVTIRQEVEREIHYAPVGAECDLSDGLYNAINKALAPPGSD